ncbi:MAG TPA: DUF6210 family protein [Kineosporiaceae bacterium]
MLDFAAEVFGEALDEDAVIGESRVTAEEWVAAEPAPPVGVRGVGAPGGAAGRPGTENLWQTRSQCPTIQAMVSQMIVEVDPYGSWPEWMYVVIHRPTGVRYEHQYGGTACLHARPEGYLVPVQAPLSKSDLDDIFLNQLRGAGTGSRYREHPTISPILERLTRAVEQIGIYMSPNGLAPIGDGEPQALRIDPDRVSEIDEAWVPVLTPDGPGVLIWPNSD